MSDFDDEPRADGAGGDDGWDDDAPAPSAKERAPRKARPARPAAPPADDDWDDDWDDDRDRGGKRDLTLVYAVVAATIVIVLAIVLTQGNDDEPTASGDGGATPTEQSQATAPSKNWQGGVGDAAGEAQARAEGAPGIYIWTDFGGWHVRNNGSEDAVVTIAADQVKVKKTDDGDDGDESAEEPFTTEAQVTVPAGDGAEGVGFDLGVSEAVTITVARGGQNVPADQIFLGGGQAVASANPVELTKA